MIAALQAMPISPAPNADLWAWAKFYSENRISVLPIKRGEKHPYYWWRGFHNVKLWQVSSKQGLARMQQFYSFSQHEGLAAVCGLASDGMFTFDCETTPALQYVLSSLEERGIQAPYISHGEGGHVLMRVTRGAVKSIELKVMGNIEIRGGGMNAGRVTGALAVLPPTPNAAGSARAWYGGEVPEIDPDDLGIINFLQDTNGKTVSLEIVGNEQDFGLHQDTIRYLVEGSAYPEGIRNDSLFNSSRDYRHNGLDISEALQDLLPIATQSGLAEREATATIKSAYKKRRDSQHPTNEKTLSQQQQLERYFASLQWTGRTGATDYAVIQSLLERRRKDGHSRANMAFRASYREIKEDARVSNSKSLKGCIGRLIARGFIELEGRTTKGKGGASVWRFTEKALKEAADFSTDVHSTATLGTAVYCVHNKKKAETVLSETKALGKRGYEVYRRLQAMPQSASAIASALGLSVKSVYPHLRAVIDAGLAYKQGKLYHAQGTILDALSVAAVVRTHTKRKENGEYKALNRPKSARRQAYERARYIDEERALFAVNGVLKFMWNYEQRREQELKESRFNAWEKRKGLVVSRPLALPVAGIMPLDESEAYVQELERTVIYAHRRQEE